MGDDYTGKHHETRVGVHRKPANPNYRPRHLRADVDAVVSVPVKVERTTVRDTKKVARTTQRDIDALPARFGYTPQHTRSAKSANKRANATARDLRREKPAKVNGLASALRTIWNYGKP